MFTIKAKLKELRRDLGGYILYVFENLDDDKWYSKYISTVRFPNWEEPFVNIGDIGYLDFKEVIAGKDTWWDKVNNKYVPYNYDNRIFIRFVKECEHTDLTVML